MAGNRIDVTLSVNDDSGSLKKRNQEAKELNQNLTKAAQSAERALRPAARRQREVGENIEYGRGRGSMGATGAEARDFANQAQGLGGLVRLYATYAANVFAVSAAFNALRQAEATSMMVKGMDQLGAASGMALGGMAKQLVMVTDGAVSLREAMEATTKATASGLSRDQLMELGKVAKGASQALGVNMTDALSRLSRGITKLEPELLDELGIFTKVGKATEDYAKSVNKSVDSLTDFEKRQAFANAVLKEGRDKFGEIAAQANPYDKLLSSLSNVAQKILEIINIGLKPLVTLFAENTGLIAAAIAVVAAKIFQQAIPAITSWRDNIAKAAQASAKAASDLKVTFGENVVGRLTQQFDVANLDKKLKKATTDYDNAVNRFIASDNNYKNKSSVLEALRAGQELSSKQLATLQADANKRMNEGSEANRRHAQAALEIVAARKQVLDITKEQGKADQAFYGDTKKYSEEWQRESIARQRLAKAERMELLSGVGTQVEQKGFGAGLGAFYQDVDSSKNLQKWDKLKTKAVGTLVGISTAVGIAAQAFAPFMIVIEAAAAAFLILDSIFSNNEKQLSAFKNSVDSLQESVKTATNVNEKYGLSFANTQAVIAYSNALTNVSADVTNLVKSLEAADKYATWWDRRLDDIKVIWGGNLKSVFAKNIGQGLEASIKAVPMGPLRVALEEKLKSSLGTLDFGKAFAGMSKEEIFAKGDEVSKIVGEVQKIVDKSKILAENVKETNKASEQSFINFSNAVFKPTQMATFLLDTTKNVLALRDAFKDSVAAPAAFKDIISGITKLEFFSPETAAELTSITEAFKRINGPIEQQEKSLAKAKDRIKEIDGLLASRQGEEARKLRTERASLERQIPGLEKGIADAITKSAPKVEELGKLMGESLGRETSKRLDLVFKEVNLRIKQVEIASKQSALGALPRETPEVVKERTRLELEALKVEKELRLTQENLINSVDLLRVELELGRQLQEKTNIMSARGMTDEQRSTALGQQEKLIANTRAKREAMLAQDIPALRSLVSQNPDLAPLLTKLGNKQVIETQARQRELDTKMRGELAIIDATARQDRQKLEAEISALKAEQDSASMTLTENAAENTRRGLEIQGLDAKIREVDTQALLAKTTVAEKFGGQGVSVESVKREIALEAERLKNTKDIADAAEKQRLSVAEQVALVEELTNRYQIATSVVVATSEAIFNDRKAQLESQRTQLDIAQQNGLINQDEFNQRTQILALQDAELERDRAIFSIRQKTAEESLQWRKKLAQANGIINDDLQAEIAAIIERGNISQQQVEKELQNKKLLAKINFENNTTQAKLARDFEGVFAGITDKMTDAFINFAETGKLSFKELANSVIADIARIIIRMQILNMMESMFGKGFSGNAGNWFAKIFTSAASSAAGGFVPSGGEGSMYVLSSEMPKRAKGAAYTNTGVEMYAKGGMFTNKIVAEPTLFKFAKGTGMMGEAGPEAIMPLRRDGDGNLGVIAQPQQGKVEVVVNNYSGEKAETRETVDSRGNRKIEVVVGEMVAGELGRKNSPIQQSMMANFMTKPATVRR